MNSYDIYANNGDVWIAHGGFDDKYTANGNRDGISHFNGKWKNYGLGIQTLFDTVSDIVGIVKDEHSGIVYGASFLDGLVIVKPNDDLQIIKQNSIFDSSTAYFGYGQRQMLGIAIDKTNNLWLGSYSSKSLLYVQRSIEARQTDSNSPIIKEHKIPRKLLQHEVTNEKSYAKT